MPYIAPNLYLAVRDFEFRYSKSSGPGGQKVNKSNTQVELLWDFEKSPKLSEEKKQILRQKLSRRQNKEGKLQVVSDRFRNQERNRQDCIDKLVTLVEKVFHKEKKRIPTRLSKAKKNKRQENKKKHSDKKNLRQKLKY